MQDFQYGLSADKNQGEKVFQAFFQILSIALHPERELPDRRKHRQTITAAFAVIFLMVKIWSKT